MAAKKSTAVVLPPLKIATIEIPLIGDSPLICHAWSKKAKQQMLDKQMKKATNGREAKDPWQDFCESLYWLDGMPEEPSEQDVINGRFGFPAIGFKAAAVTACTSIGSMTKVAARQAFHIDGEFVEIIGPPPSMREDTVRIGMGTADIRFRGEFNPWSALVRVKYNTGVLSADQVANLFNVAGFACGIGDWRPEKDGPYGRFRVGTEAEMAA